MAAEPATPIPTKVAYTVPAGNRFTASPRRNIVGTAKGTATSGPHRELLRVEVTTDFKRDGQTASNAPATAIYIHSIRGGCWRELCLSNLAPAGLMAGAADRRLGQKLAYLLDRLMHTLPLTRHGHNGIGTRRVKKPIGRANGGDRRGTHKERCHIGCGKLY